MISKSISRRTSKSCISAEIRELAIGQNFPYHHSKRPNVRLHCIIPVTWFRAMIVWPYALWCHPLERKSFRLTRPNISGKWHWSRVSTYIFYKDKNHFDSDTLIWRSWNLFWVEQQFVRFHFSSHSEIIDFCFFGFENFSPITDGPSDEILQFWTEPYWNI